MNERIVQLAREIVAATYSQPSDWFSSWAQGGTTADSGIAVNYNTALTYSSVFAAVDIISSDTASLPLNDTTLDEEDNKTVNRGSQVQWLLNSQPNVCMTAFTFRRTLTAHMLLQGNGYAAIERDMSNVPKQLIPIRPELVRPFLDEDGNVWYDVPRLLADPLPSSEMLHILGLSRDGINGISVVTNARNSFGLGLAEEKHGNSHFKNGASPKVVLKTDRNLSEEEAELLLKSWSAKQEGTANAGKTALAAGGLQIETVGVSNEDAQWLESRKFQRSEVATWFTLPEHMINGEKGPYNSTIAENLGYLRRTLKKHLCSWEQESERKLIPERFRRTGRRILRHDTADLLSADPETKAEIATKLVAGEVWTRNEGRRSMGMNRHDSPIADQLSSPNTRTDNAAATSDEPPAEAMDATRYAISSKMAKLISGEVKSVSNAVSRAKNFTSWLDTFYAKRVGDMATELEPILAVYSSIPGITCHTTSTAIAEDHVARSKHELLEAVGIAFPENLAETVTELTNQWSIRADAVADAVIGTTR